MGGGGVEDFFGCLNPNLQYRYIPYNFFFPLGVAISVRFWGLASSFFLSIYSFSFCYCGLEIKCLSFVFTRAFWGFWGFWGLGFVFCLGGFYLEIVLFVSLGVLSASFGLFFPGVLYDIGVEGGGGVWFLEKVGCRRLEEIDVEGG